MSVLTCSEIPLKSLQALLARFSIKLERVDDGQDIPGSWFGEPEAGIISNKLYVRGDTPVHSALHESCHYICMSEDRRAQLHTNAGGGYDEENGVCFLSILLSDFIDDFSRQRMFKDMDEWGYTFRLGSSKAWFQEDATDARDWLILHGLISNALSPCWKLRQ